jgi:gamma-glutamyltranspeptidase / glutathione hydrolase
MRAITHKATFASTGLALAALLATGLGASHATAAGSPYSISARALVGPDGTDVYIQVTPAVETLDKVQLKAWPLATGQVDTRNFFDVPAAGGLATLRLDGIERGRRIEVSAHVKDGSQNNLDTEAIVRLRPDLVVEAMTVPSDVTRRHLFDVRIAVAEADGDTAATAAVTLVDGTKALATQLVSVPAGGRAELVFPVTLDLYGAHTLHAEIAGADPGESDISNNGAMMERSVHRYLADGVVSTDDAAATKAGVDILRAGGNAFDAAAAVFFALNVTDPHLAGVGGAANIVVQRADGTRFTIDGREQAAAATTPEMFKGPAMAQVGLNGYAVGVPGALRAVDEMLRLGKGTMTLGQTLQPAIGLAEHGISVGAFLAADAASSRMTSTTPELQAIFRPGGSPVVKGQHLEQPDLAKTFRLIADQGESVFYRGEIAQAIVAAQKWKTLPEGAGRMTLDDLANYDVRVEDPLTLKYEGDEVLGAPPSTCGGLVVLEALGLIEHFRNDPAHAGYSWTFGDPQTLHVMMEALRLAYADRNMWMGDDDFYAVPTAGLLSDGYLEERSKLIKPGVLVPGAPLPTIRGIAPPGNPFPYQPHVDAVAEDESSPDAHTTHFSIVDQWGNAVAFTATVTDSFGSGILVPGYGFVLNDTNVNFNLGPARNATTGNPGANDAGPGKRAMGNTAPTLVVRDGEPIVGTGSLGAKFIPSVVLQVVIDALDFGMPIQEAVDAPRFWGQNADGDFALNPGLAAAILPLRDLGHTAQWSNGNVARATSFPGVGSINSFAVATDTITLSGGADATRHPDATATVVTR